jgi:hypothetical protein
MMSRAKPVSSALWRCLPLAFAAFGACVPAPGDFDIVQELQCGVRLGSCVCVRLDEHYNNDGIGSKEDTPDGNFDIPDVENGDTFPRQGMPDGGEFFRPPGVEGAAFIFPLHADGEDNNVACKKQTVRVEPGMYGTLLVLGASEADSQESTLALLHVDGGRTEFPLKLTDWCQPARYGEVPVLRWKYRIDTRGRREQTPCALFVQTVDLPPAVVLTGVELPDNPRIHVFALALHDGQVKIDEAAVASVPELEYEPEPPPRPLRRLRPPPPPPADFTNPGPGMATVALVPTGLSAPQRWADVAGNEYEAVWREAFSYGNARVRVAYAQRGATFDGAIMARGLKPNFAYQIKLVGDRADTWSFETIGYLGRWLIDPANTTRTNFRDMEYRRRKDDPGLEIEAYILFDYFVTDHEGNATKSFSLDSSYHVLWSRTLNRKRRPRREDSQVFAHTATPTGNAYSPSTPGEAVTVQMWLEHEWVNRRPAKTRLRLPAGTYRAAVQLTEESFHLTKKGGWARVLRGPVEFEILDEDAVPPGEDG